MYLVLYLVQIHLVSTQCGAHGPAGRVRPSANSLASAGPDSYSLNGNKSGLATARAKEERKGGERDIEDDG